MSSTRIDRQQFLANLRRSNLLSPEEYSTAVEVLPETERALTIARTLVQRKVLTRFQAEMLLAGRTAGFVIGQYRVLDQVGRGGMGRVFKAMHQTMNRVVALKVISSSAVKNERSQQMFMREVRAAAKLMHPNIVTAYDANQIGDRHYLVMEYVDGPNLEQLVADKGPLAVGMVCDFIRQAALGLQYAHEVNMVHRDIKPANLLVQGVHGNDGKATRCNVKILDFGLARLHDPKPDAVLAPVAPQTAGSYETKQNMVVGTPDYIAPEQARDLHSADIRSDLYSLGCSFHFLLTGQVPFPANSVMEKLVRHGTEDPAPVEKLRPEVPPVVGAIVRRLMSKDPARRYQTPAELAAALTPFAVAGPPPWTTNEPGEVAELDSKSGLSTDSTEPESALVGTLAANQSLTPLSDDGTPMQTPPPRGNGLVVLSLILSFLVASILFAGVIALVIFWPF